MKMAASPLSISIGIGMEILGVRGLWKLQHTLDLAASTADQMQEALTALMYNFYAGCRAF